MKLVGYTRWSPRRNAESCLSTEQQQEAIEKWAKAQEHEIMFSFSDAALTGTDTNRPGLWQAIEKLKKGWGLCVWKYDRLSRNAFDAVSIERQVLSRGAVLLSASGEKTVDDNMSAADKFMVGILRQAAEYEAALIAERTSIAMRHHQRQGRIMSSNTPYGWGQDVNDKTKMVPDPQEQEAIKFILAKKRDGWGLRKIAGALNESSNKARSGYWYPATIGRIIKREA